MKCQNTHAASKDSDTVMANRDPLSGKVSDDQPGATAGILQVEGVNPGHDAQHRMTNRYKAVIERRSRKAEEHEVPADAIPMVVLLVKY